jgi:N-acetylmuramic acid 6-phosphate etherase
VPPADARPPLDRVRVEAPTETRNQRTRDIDLAPTLQLLELINAEDATVPTSVAAALPALAELVDRTFDRVRGGGRLHYAGAGTSGRIAVLDAAELVPTYGLDKHVVVAHLAGGDLALRHSLEDVEDSPDAGAHDLSDVCRQDVVLGVAASGRTPYVAGALQQARRVGAFTALLSSNPEAPLAEFADLHVLVDTGAEAITGSTRMKAGTAQKLVLNSLSTALAIRLGRTWSNLMVDLVASNAKLRGRAVAILEEATGRPEAECLDALDRAGGQVKVALVCLLIGCPADEARDRLRTAAGHVRDATAPA